MIDSKQCRECEEIKPISDFTIDRSSKDGLDRRCRACKKSRWSGYWQNNKQELAPANRDRVREWAKNNPERRNTTCRKAWNENRDSYRETSKRCRIKLKTEVIGAYGGKCACCSIDALEFLTIDHIYGGGTKHRQSLSRGSGDLYRHLRDQGFPDGYQVLCWNCNFSKHYGRGVCYHQREHHGG